MDLRVDGPVSDGDGSAATSWEELERSWGGDGGRYEGRNLKENRAGSCAGIVPEVPFVGRGDGLRPRLPWRPEFRFGMRGTEGVRDGSERVLSWLRSLFGGRPPPRRRSRTDRLARMMAPGFEPWLPLPGELPLGTYRTVGAW